MEYIQQAIEELDEIWLDKTKCKKLFKEKLHQAFELGKEEEKNTPLTNENYDHILQKYKADLIQWCGKRIYLDKSEYGDIEDEVKEELIQYLTK